MIEASTLRDDDFFEGLSTGKKGPKGVVDLKVLEEIQANTAWILDGEVVPYNLEQGSFLD
ncbi:MAG: hypothetical protein QM490_00405 [Candidatus Gracilibacteria bacterium]